MKVTPVQNMMGTEHFMARILPAIQNEMFHAQEKWPEFPLDVVHAAGIVSEEAGELQRAANRAKWECTQDPNYNRSLVIDMKLEAIQTIVTCLRMIWMLDLQFFNEDRRDDDDGDS